MTRTAIGVDEAGRGPVFGSLFVAGVRGAPDHNPIRSSQDSKSISKEKIRSTVQELQQHPEIQIAVIEIPATDITQSDNITRLTIKSMSRLVDVLTTTNDEIFIDACHTNPSKMATSMNLPDGTVATIEHEADDKYDIVGAASCVAKYHRDKHIESLLPKYPNYSIGSGYPSDPTTREFLKQYYSDTGQFPNETRLTWSTCDDIKEEIEQTTLDT